EIPDLRAREVATTIPSPETLVRVDASHKAGRWRLMMAFAASLEKAGRTIRSYGLVLVQLWFEGTQFDHGESGFLCGGATPLSSPGQSPQPRSSEKSVREEKVIHLPDAPTTAQ